MSSEKVERQLEPLTRTNESLDLIHGDAESKGVDDDDDSREVTSMLHGGSRSPNGERVSRSVNDWA